MREGFGVWVYAVVRELDPTRVSDMRGVGQEPVRTLRGGDLTALVGTVDLDAFGEEALQRDLNDMTSLENIARAHHRVIEATFRMAPTIPARLATMYHDDEGVVAMLAENHTRLEDTLAQITEHAEWGVKAYVVETPGRPESGEVNPSGVDASQQGTAYLLRRRAQISAIESAWEEGLSNAQEVHAALRRIATAAREHAAQDARLSGRSERMVLNGAYLVRNEFSKVFTDTVAEVGDRHRVLRLELTGPWPAYSFTLGVEGQRA